MIPKQAIEKKGYALMFNDADGAYTKGCKTKEEAMVAFERMFVDELLTGQDRPNITMADVKESRYFKHKKCDGDTIGDGGDCYFCGEPHQGVGRATFTINF